jgi:lambda family phage tail tape measure protein
MTVALSSLRVVTEGDSSSYTKSMQDVATANDKATASAGRFTDAQGNQVTYLSRTGDALSMMSSRLERVVRSLDPAYASATNFAKTQTTLQSALDRGGISVDRYNQLMALASSRFEDAAKRTAPFAGAVSGISAQMVAMSAGLGPVGVALAGFGPLGLIAAAGFGAASSAMGYLREQADQFGEKASKLHDFAETAGLSAVQLQVLQHAGAGVGLTVDTLQASFEKFSVSLGELKTGTGAFFDGLQRVDPELTRQIAVTKDVAKAWDLLSEAYARAGQQQQAQIARAAFGRGGAGTGRLLSATEEAGGIAGLQSKTTSTFDDATLQRIGGLKTLLDQTRDESKDVLASIYSEQVLQGQVKFALKQKEINESIKETSTQFSYWRTFLNNLVESEGGGAPAPPDPMEIARQRLATGLTSNAMTGNNGTEWSKNTWQPQQPQAGQPQGPQQPSADYIANEMKRTVSALGSASTAYEQQKSKILDLDAALAKNSITQETYNRAVAGLKLDTTIALESQRLGLLGELAPISETVAQKELQIAAARMKGVDITKAEAAAIVDLTKTQADGARLQQQVTLGVASEVQIRAQLQKELRGNVEKGLLDPRSALQMADANTVLAKSFEKMSEQAQLARAPLEQLKKWEIDAGNFRLQVDTTAVSAINQMTTSIVDFTTGSKTATAAFRDFGKSVIRMLEEMIVKMLLANLLQQALGGGSGIGALGSALGALTAPGGGTAGYNPTSLAGLWHGGGMMDEPSGTRHVDPAAFMKAPRFHTGVGPDEIAAVIKKDEGVFTPGQMRALGPAGGGGGSKTTVNVVNNSGGAAKTTKRRDGNGGDVIDVVISAVGKHMANGGYDAQLRARTGTQIQPRGR